MPSDYLQSALRRARYEFLEDDSRFYGEIPDCLGVYAEAPTLEAFRDELAEVLEEWVVFRVSRDLPISILDGIELAVREVA